MRLLVDSRGPTLAMSLRGSYDVLDVRPSALPDALADGGAAVDAAVLDLGDDAGLKLAALRDARPGLPVLVLGAAADLAIEDAPDGVRFLSLPVSRSGLLEALAQLLAGHEHEQPADVEPDLAGSDVTQPEASTPISAPPVESEPGSDKTEPGWPSPEPDAAEQERDTSSPEPVPVPPPPHAPAALPLPRDPDEAGVAALPAPAVAAVGELPSPAQAAVQPVPAPDSGPRVAPDSLNLSGVAGVGRLVRDLLWRAPDLLTLAEVAEVVVLDAVDRVDAEAVALLVPDDELWRVAGGVGLRPLEWRCEIDGGSWLVSEVVEGAAGLVVEDTDIARQRLQGAPLAAWRQLLAVPVPGVRGCLLGARSEAPFTVDDVSRLAGLAREAADPLADAVALRRLARSLRAHLGDAQDV